jgi:hypothetical protein
MSKQDLRKLCSRASVAGGNLRGAQLKAFGFFADERRERYQSAHDFTDRVDEANLDSRQAIPAIRLWSSRIIRCE